jgi:hypothetical protein
MPTNTPKPVDLEALIDADDELEVWERCPGEPAKDYAAFRLFRDLPSLNRGTGIVATQTDLSERRIRQLSQQWRWFERAQAWDDACHQTEDRERLEAIRAMHAVHRRAGRMAIGKALQALNLLSIEDMRPTAIARLMELGAKLERQTLIVSVEELQGIEPIDEDSEDPWERIAAELNPANIDLDDLEDADL